MHLGALVVFHACGICLHTSTQKETQPPVRPEGSLISEVCSTTSLESLYFADAHISVVFLSQTNALPLSLHGLIYP